MSGGHLTRDRMAAALTQALGKTVRNNEVSPETFRGFGFPGADDLGNMFQFYRDFAEACNTMRDVARSRRFYPGLQSFEAWLTSNAARIPLN